MIHPRAVNFNLIIFFPGLAQLLEDKKRSTITVILQAYWLNWWAVTPTKTKCFSRMVQKTQRNEIIFFLCLSSWRGHRNVLLRKTLGSRSSLWTLCLQVPQKMLTKKSLTLEYPFLFFSSLSWIPIFTILGGTYVETVIFNDKRQRFSAIVYDF